MLPTNTPSPSNTVPLPIFDQHGECTKCSLYSSVTSVGIPSRWAPWSLPPSPSTPATFFIGQNPGFHEDKQNTCFIGPTGQLTKLCYTGCILDKPGHPGHGQPIGPPIHSLSTVYLGNTARCGTWGDIKPAKKHYRTCAPYLLEDIHAIIPTCSRLLLVLLGGPAIEHTYSLLAGDGISTAKTAFDRSGELLLLQPSSKVPVGTSVQVFSTYHPAFVLRKQAALASVIDHLQLVVDALCGLSAIPSSPIIIPPDFHPHHFVKPPPRS